jgi:hypothetical protein
MAIWMDGSDMLIRADVRSLLTKLEIGKAAAVVKHDYQTSHPRKYIGTEMENDNKNYPRKNWSSFILWNCEHPANKCLTPPFVSSNSGDFLHRFQWLKDDLIGSLHPDWNHLVGEQEYNPNAKIAHFTLGIPSFEHYGHCDYAEEWHKI